MVLCNQNLNLSCCDSFLWRRGSIDLWGYLNGGYEGIDDVDWVIFIYEGKQENSVLKYKLVVRSLAGCGNSSSKEIKPGEAEEQLSEKDVPTKLGKRTLPITYPVSIVLNQDHSYSRSLALFAAALGPFAWEVTSLRMEQALPTGTNFGHGGLVIDSYRDEIKSKMLQRSQRTP
ncbi:hypothetical protein C5167_047660 [Papaver somniferum]|uniref:Uncharacterized protein n=1 Tax=Papaver somniferum TaxID=3469 RepID=A0A4Y7LHA3_PAPSO|nr:hypothetical protein C5167_047660 [Papaver somniferum]